MSEKIGVTQVVLVAPMVITVVDRVYKKRAAEDTITNITLGSALKSWFE